MRKALLIGIDDYPQSPLKGCVEDVKTLQRILRRHEDGSPNFECLARTSCPEKPLDISRAFLRGHVKEFFEAPADLALLYFSGHGLLNELGGFLVTKDATTFDEGVAMEDVLRLASASPIEEVVILLDCCSSGAFGNDPGGGTEVQLREGLSVLASSGEKQDSVGGLHGGVFTSLVCEALSGRAADLLGNVTVAAVYAYADQLLGAFDQRPRFKSNVSRLASLRRCKPAVPLELLRLLPNYFPVSTAEFQLDPSYEPTAEPWNPEHERIFADLQRLRAVRLVEPVGEDHMYYAAIHGKSCRLTKTGQFYWELAKRGKL